ncbi:TolC family protein [Alphaproteobacteria bacterium]|nr:TolC family protein [Alphaproteobacteria bacterium]
MLIKRVLIFFGLVLILAACSSRTPDPLVKEDVQASSQEDYEYLKESSANAPLEIDLYDAIAIAIKNNRDLRIDIMDSALNQGQIDVVKFDMLPKLSANAGYKVLEKHPASTSVSMVAENGQENKAANALGDSPSYTVSQETPSYTNDIGFTWNALDFGLSYVRAGQQANRYLISKELERKAIHNLTKEVIYAYWKTLSADELLAEINPLMDRVNKALEDYEYIEELLISSPMDALLYQKELLDVAQILNTQRRALMDSRTQLATLMGLMPGQEYLLIKTEKPLSELVMGLEEQEEAALFSRPELLEIRYQAEVTAKEARASMLSLLPSLQFNATWTYDSNKYLLNKNNTEYGAVFGANLLNIFQAGNINDVNKINKQIIEEQRLALSMAVLSQVHIANINYAQSLREYSNAKHYLSVAQRINELIANAQKISRFGELEVIREEASLLVSRLRNDIAFAELQYSLGTLYSSVGMTFVPDNLAQITDEELAIALKENLNRWTKTYNVFVNRPINEQNPILEDTDKVAVGNVDSFFDFVEFKFEFDRNTFYLEGSGKTRLAAKLANGDSLPPWLVFLPSQHTFAGKPPQESGSLDITVEASNDVAFVSDTFTLSWGNTQLLTKLKPKKENTKQIGNKIIINEDQLNELNMALDKKFSEDIEIEETINEELLDNLIAALNSMEQGQVIDVIGDVFDSSFKVKPKPKPNKTVLLSALEDSLTNQINSMTSYSPTQSAYIQIGAFKKENISLAVASDVSNKIGTDVEVIPTLISDPVMYRILVGPTHKDEIVGVIADIMELGISDYFLTHG